MNNITIASHRRSGTHYLMEFLKQNWNIDCKKTHNMGTRNLDSNTLYIVRNPIEVLHSTYLWFLQGGGSENTLIEKKFRVTFEEFINGDAGTLMGFESYYFSNKDNLQDCRGMFYDPIRYWIDHCNSYCNAQIIFYENLKKMDVETINMLTKIFGIADNILQVNNLVGHRPSSTIKVRSDIPHDSHNLHWNDKMLNMLYTKIEQYVHIDQIKAFYVK